MRPARASPRLSTSLARAVAQFSLMFSKRGRIMLCRRGHDISSSMGSSWAKAPSMRRSSRMMACQLSCSLIISSSLSLSWARA